MTETKEDAAVRVALADLRNVTNPDVGPGRFGPGVPRTEEAAKAALIAAVEARTRARLAAAVPPMTMTAEQDEDIHRDACDGLSLRQCGFAVAEIDALRAALAARDETIATLTAALTCRHGRAPLVCSVCRTGGDTRAEALTLLAVEREAHERTRTKLEEKRREIQTATELLVEAEIPMADGWRLPEDGIAELTGERDSLRAKLAALVEAADVAEKRLRQLCDPEMVRGFDEALAEALLRYNAQHIAGCAWYRDEACTCGFVTGGRAALVEARGDHE